jgi:hypothetical protein
MSEKVLRGAAAHARSQFILLRAHQMADPVFGTMLSGGREIQCNIGSFFEKTLILWTRKTWFHVGLENRSRHSANPHAI